MREIVREGEWIDAFVVIVIVATDAIRLNLAQNNYFEKKGSIRR